MEESWMSDEEMEEGRFALFKTQIFLLLINNIQATISAFWLVKNM